MEDNQRELGFAEMILRKGRPKKKKKQVAMKKSEVEEKLAFEIEMRSAAQRLLTACSNPQQRLEATKTILVSNSRTFALMNALQKEHVKQVEDAHGLTDLKDRDEVARDEMFENVSLADVTLTNICIPLKWYKIDPAKYKTDCWKYQTFCLIRSGIQVVDSKDLVKVDMLSDTIMFNDTFILKDLPPDFSIELEFYYACVDDNLKKKSKKSEQCDSAMPVFAIGATTTLTKAHCNIWQQKQALRPGNNGAPPHITAPSSLPDVPILPVLNFYRLEIDVKPHFTIVPAKEGFLDVQHMVGGLPHWKRSWCCIQGMYLKVWKRPEDQQTTNPTQIIEINEHMTFDHVTRTTSQRPHGIHISYTKPPYNDHFLSCDTKEERILWEIALRKAMINSSVWHPNKLSSVDNIGTSPSPLKSPPPKPPRPVTTPQFSYTPSNPLLPSYKGQYEAARNSRLDRLLDRTPNKMRSKSAERKRTPAPKEPSRSRANTCKKPNRRRSRSVDLTPVHGKPSLYGTPKKDRVSDATYVSMRQFSRVPLAGTAEKPKPNRPAPAPPQPPSLSKLPQQHPSGVAERPLSGVNDSYRAAVHSNTSSNRSQQKKRNAPPRPTQAPRRSPRLTKEENPQVELPTSRKNKGKAPTPSPSRQNKKSPAPSAPRTRTKVPRQSEGGTNNLNSPNRSGKRKDGLMNIYKELESCESLSPSLGKISSSPSPSPVRVKTNLTLDFENMIDEAFGSLYDEDTALSSNTTPSFKQRVTRSAKEAKAAVTPGRKVARNTPLTSTMKENGEPFNPPNNLTQLAESNAKRGGGVKWRPGIMQISEDLEVSEEEEEETVSRDVIPDRGDSLLDGYFDTSQSSLGEDEASTLNSDKENTMENETPQNLSEDYFVPAKRRSVSPTSPSKRLAISPKTVQSSPKKVTVVSSALSPSKKKPPNSPKKVAFIGGDKQPPEVSKKPKFKVVNGKLVPV